MMEHVSGSGKYVRKRLLHVLISEFKGNNTERVMTMDMISEKQQTFLDISDGNVDVNALKELLLSESASGTMTYIPHFIERIRTAFTRLISRHLLPLGYVIKPVGTRAYTYGVEISVGAKKWKFYDLWYSTKIEPHTLRFSVKRTGSRGRATYDELMSYVARYDRLDDVSLQETNVALGSTIGSTAVSMLKRTLPKGAEMWMPEDRLHVMLNLCWGMRGGMQYAKYHDGEVMYIDRKRAYLSEIAKPIPWRWTWGQAHVAGEEKPGVYVCRISGSTPFPLRIGVWNQYEGLYEPVTWYGGNDYTVLPSAEFEGYRELGVVIEPLWGYRVEQWMTLDAFASQMYRILDAYSNEPDVMAYFKSIPNNLVGLLARRPEVQEIIFTTDDPGAGWSDVIDSRGFAIENCYSREYKSWGYKMHLDVSAWVYASNKNEMYKMVAWGLRQIGRAHV